MSVPVNKVILDGEEVSVSMIADDILFWNGNVVFADRVKDEAGKTVEYLTLRRYTLTEIESVCEVANLMFKASIEDVVAGSVRKILGDDEGGSPEVQNKDASKPAEHTGGGLSRFFRR